MDEDRYRRIIAKAKEASGANTRKQAAEDAPKCEGADRVRAAAAVAASMSSASPLGDHEDVFEYAQSQDKYTADQKNKKDTSFDDKPAFDDEQSATAISASAYAAAHGKIVSDSRETDKKFPVRKEEEESLTAISKRAHDLLTTDPHTYESKELAHALSASLQEQVSSKATGLELERTGDGAGILDQIKSPDTKNACSTDDISQASFPTAPSFAAPDEKPKPDVNPGARVVRGIDGSQRPLGLPYIEPVDVTLVDGATTSIFDATVVAISDRDLIMSRQKLLYGILFVVILCISITLALRTETGDIAPEQNPTEQNPIVWGSPPMFYPNTSQCVITVQNKIKDDNDEEENWFGSRVFMLGSNVLVAAPKDDEVRGAVYIYNLTDSSKLMFQSKIVAWDVPPPNSWFGRSVAMTVGTIFVGADGDSNFRGAVYVFSQNSEGFYKKLQKIIASDGIDGDQFGFTLGAFGDTLVIGSVGDKRGGAAYFFELDSTGVWKEVQKVVGNRETTQKDGFAFSFAITSDEVMIGAPRENLKIGAVYIFSHTAEGWWNQTEKLTAKDQFKGDKFGFSLDVSGDNLVVGAMLDNNHRGQNVGAAYVFTRGAGEGWKETQKLIGDDLLADDQFGFSVAMFNNTIIVGANREDHGSYIDVGAAYIFSRDGYGQWFQKKKIVSADGESNALFGKSLAINQNVIIISAIGNSSVYTTEVEC